MSIYSITYTCYFAKCDWCEKVIEFNYRNALGNLNTEWSEYPELPDGWIKDWDAVKRSSDDPPVYCSKVHMDRARQVAVLKALP